MHELCVLTMIFRLLLMKFTMTCSECVLLILYHNMPNIFINHFTARVHCFVQRILRVPVELVPAHFSNVFFFTPACVCFRTIKPCLLFFSSLFQGALSSVSKGKSLPTVDNTANSCSLLKMNRKVGLLKTNTVITLFRCESMLHYHYTLNHFTSTHTHFIKQ